MGSDDREPLRTRVLLAGLDRLPRTLLTSLLNPVPGLDVVVREEIEDVAPPGTVGELIHWLERIGPDVVVLGASDSVSLGTLRRVLASRVILVRNRGRVLHCYQLEPRQATAREASPRELLAMVSGARDEGPDDVHRK